MRGKVWLIVVIVLLLLVGGAVFAVNHIRISALDEPSRTETYLATKAKIWIVRHNARSVPPGPPYTKASAAIGGMQFRGECASCHGVEGHQPSDIGRWMYPRTLDLGSPEVQEWSDAELLWIIKNGIRLSGMPAFGKIHNDEQIWHLVHYVRSLGTPPKH
jgi:mono/diheme cytochrome c family protein